MCSISSTSELPNGILALTHSTLRASKRMLVGSSIQIAYETMAQQSEANPVTPLRAPKWRARKEQPIAPSTGELLRLLRYEYWAGALRPGHFYHFEAGTPPDTSGEKCTPDLSATLLCAA